MRYAKGITKISLCCGILSSLIWQDTIDRAVGHYTVSRDYDVTDQECGLSFPDHLPRPRQDGGRKWAGTSPARLGPTYNEAPGAGRKTLYVGPKQAGLAGDETTVSQTIFRALDKMAAGSGLGTRLK